MCRTGQRRGKLPVDRLLFRNLEPIVPAAVWCTVAVDAQFRDADEALDVVGPMEVEGRIADGLAYLITRHFRVPGRCR